MPVKSVVWQGSSGPDIHLIPGYTGPRLDHLLWIESEAGYSRADQPPSGVTVTFAPNFVSSALGARCVAVSAQGEVTVTGPLPRPRLLSFLVIATVTDGSKVLPSVYRRFCIHDAIAGTWLTPAPLTVRQNTRRCRFTLLAEFDDGRYGDLTAWCPAAPATATDCTYVHPTGNAAPAIVWSSDTPGVVAVDPSTGMLNCTVSAGTAGITALAAGTSASATANAAPGWAVPRTLTPIPGSRGFSAMSTTKNILILPDGFTAAERGAFEKMAGLLVARLRTRTRVRPFDILSRSLNYFMAWVESPQAGISPQEEVQTSHVTGSMADASEVDTQIEPGNIYMTAASPVGTPSAPGSSDRFLINERDTAFAVVLGERPAAKRVDDMQAAGFHPARHDDRDFDDFLRALCDRSGTPVGATWSSGGKDQDQVMLLCHSKRDAGTTGRRWPGGRYVAMTLGYDDHHRIEDDRSRGPGKHLRPDPIPGKPTVDIWATAAHELGHTMGLGDEYGDQSGHGGVLPSGWVAGLAAAANVQPRDRLLGRDSQGNPTLDASKVKWRWPRIRAAGVLTAVPSPDGTRYRVRMKKGHAAAFRVGYVVRFRRRPLVNFPFSIRPNADIGGSATSPRWPNLVDGSDSTYVNLDSSGTTAQVGLADMSVPSSTVIESVTIRVRAWTVSGSHDLTVSQVLGGRWDEVFSLDPTPADYVGTPRPAKPGSAPWTLADINNLEIALSISSGVIRVAELSVDVAITPAPATDRFLVVSVAPPELVVEPLTGAAFDPAGFPDGSVLIAPVRDRDPDPAAHSYGDDLELMHSRVRERMNDTRNPLNAHDGEGPDRPCTGNRRGTAGKMMGATNFPLGRAPRPPPWSAWIVGLYENGAECDCGVYHPTGICLMRSQDFVNKKNQDQAYDFCPVCRYAIVDLIDPSKHGEIEDLYNPNYPGFGP